MQLLCVMHSCDAFRHGCMDVLCPALLQAVSPQMLTMAEHRPSTFSTRAQNAAQPFQSSWAASPAATQLLLWSGT